MHLLPWLWLYIGPVFYRYLADSAVRGSEEKAPSAYAAEVTWSSWTRFWTLPHAAVEALDGLDALDLVHLEARGLKDRTPNVV